MTRTKSVPHVSPIGIVLVVVAVLAIGGGVYYFVGNKTTTTASSNYQAFQFVYASCFPLNLPLTGKLLVNGVNMNNFGGVGIALFAPSTQVGFTISPIATTTTNLDGTWTLPAQSVAGKYNIAAYNPQLTPLTVYVAANGGIDPSGNPAFDIGGATYGSLIIGQGC